jgi:hypothetical protein
VRRPLDHAIEDTLEKSRLGVIEQGWLSEEKAWEAREVIREQLREEYAHWYQQSED